VTNYIDTRLLRFAATRVVQCECSIRYCQIVGRYYLYFEYVWSFSGWYVYTLLTCIIMLCSVRMGLLFCIHGV
jgi:hypothetical protein